jgi:ubiquinone/menaquinone biosynthesis C-methylase UbiE
MKSDARFVPALGRAWLTPCYDVVVRTTTRERRFKRALIEQAGLTPGQRVLDLATGTGTLAIWMKQRQPLLDVTAVDGDPAIMAIASSKAAAANADVRWVEALSTELPFPPAHFDRVVSSLFFHHLTWENKVHTAREVFRVLKPGGELHVADWGRPTGLLMRGLFVTIQLLDGFESTRDNVAGKLITLLEQAGFVDVCQRQAINTIYGTMALHAAVRPDLHSLGTT